MSVWFNHGVFTVLGIMPLIPRNVFIHNMAAVLLLLQTCISLDCKLRCLFTAFIGWCYCIYHKRIGIMYVLFGTLAGVFGFAVSLFMRLLLS